MGARVDRELVESPRKGDQSAFVDLVRARGDSCFAIAHRILREVDGAEDALQDALVIAWRDLPDLRRARVALFTTYKLAIGSIVKVGRSSITATTGSPARRSFTKSTPRCFGPNSPCSMPQISG